MDNWEVVAQVELLPQLEANPLSKVHNWRHEFLAYLQKGRLLGDPWRGKVASTPCRSIHT